MLVNSLEVVQVLFLSLPYFGQGNSMGVREGWFISLPFYARGNSLGLGYDFCFFSFHSVPKGVDISRWYLEFFPFLPVVK